MIPDCDNKNWPSQFLTQWEQLNHHGFGEFWSSQLHFACKAIVVWSLLPVVSGGLILLSRLISGKAKWYVNAHNASSTQKTTLSSLPAHTSAASLKPKMFNIFTPSTLLCHGSCLGNLWLTCTGSLKGNIVLRAKRVSSVVVADQSVPGTDALWPC